MALGFVLMFAVMHGWLRDAMKNESAYAQEIARQIVGSLSIHGLSLAGCLIGVRFVHRRPVACVFTDGRPFRFRLAVQSAGLWAVLWLAGTVAVPGGWNHLAQRAGEVPLAWWPALSVVTLCAIALQSTNEEVVFRGYLLTRVAAWVKRPWLAVCVMAIVFTAMHANSSLAAKTAIAAIAIAFGAACVRAGTLAPMIGAHAAQNALQALWFPKDTNAGATWADPLVVVVELSIWLGWLYWATRRTPADVLAQPAGSSGRRDDA
jgi:membrane protease YdiL (CAAX protease family)